MNLYDSILAAYDNNEGWRLVLIASTDESKTAQTACLFFAILRGCQLPTIPTTKIGYGRFSQHLDEFIVHHQSQMIEARNRALRSICDAVEGE